MRLKFCLFSGMALLLNFTCQEARADFKDGNQLYSICADKSDILSHAFCLGYVEAVADTVAGRANTYGTACMTENVIGNQVTDVVVKWLESHPEARSYSGQSVVVAALVQAFPCAKP